MTPAPFDFRKPPPGELGRQVVRWLTGACRSSARNWSRLLPYPAELELGPIEVVSATAGLEALSDDVIAIPLATANPEDGAPLLLFHRPVLLALLAGLVGETSTALPADREPTELEQSLLGYLVQELFIEGLEKAWPAADPPRIIAGTSGSPRKVWTGGGGDLLLFVQFNLTAPFGAHPVYLLVPRSGVWAKLGAAASRSKPPSAVPTEHIQALVREMTVELTVLLGSAELSMQDLAGLHAGDVVILRQKVDQPLDGLLAGTRMFRVWPGVVGDRAAIVIDASAAGE